MLGVGSLGNFWKLSLVTLNSLVCSGVETTQREKINKEFVTGKGKK